MEASAGRGGSLTVPPSQPPRKEWRAVSDHSFQPNGTEETEHAELDQSDERTIYEEGAGPLDVDFCSFTIDGGEGLSDDILQQRIHNVSRQREELQRMEIDLKAQAIARSEILEVQSNFESQIKEHADVAARLKEQLQEREQQIHDLELKLEEKDRELRAVKMDNEAAWAKGEATLRRERNNSETERAQHLQQIHDLQEHIREKESQFLALEEQHRVAQETIIYKDEQLREAQAWVARVQEMGALQSTTNQSLQVQLRERIEQFNQYYIGFQRQFVDMERHHLQAIQQLQLELAEVRERNGVYTEGSQGGHGNSASSSLLGNEGNQIKANDNGTPNGNSGFISNGNLDGAPSFISSSNASTEAEHVPGVPFFPSSILGVGDFLAHGQMTSLHPYALQPQVAPQTVSSANSPSPQPQVGHIQPVPVIPAHQHWQNQQVISEVLPIQSKSQLSPTGQNVLRLDARYGHEIPMERQAIQPDHVSTSINQQQRSGPVMDGTSEEVLESNAKEHGVSQESQEILTANSQFHATLGFDVPVQESELKVHEDNTVSAMTQEQEQSLTMGQQWSASDEAVSATHKSIACDNTADHNMNVSRSTELCVSAAQAVSSLIPAKAMEPTLLDERSLLACIVRAIPSGSASGIRISTTLPNRLAKMLTPLHWHDYKKHYGKLDDFVAQHPELFVIEGDFIHLREGAQEIISATTAVAKVAAASSAPYSSFLPSVAVTPVAQNSRHKRAPSVDPRSGNIVSFAEGSSVTGSGDLMGRHSQTSKMQNHQPNGVCFNIVQGISDIRILSKSKDLQEANCLSTELRPANSSVHATVGNGAKMDRSGLTPVNKSLSNGRHGFGGRRSSGTGSISRR